jgi:hypothetical protein
MLHKIGADPRDGPGKFCGARRHINGVLKTNLASGYAIR